MPIPLILGILLILFFFVVLFLCANTWRAGHLVGLAFVFLAAVSFTVLAALSLKTRAVWLGLYDKTSKELAAEKDAYETLLDGVLTEVVQEKPSLRSAQAALLRATADRGRVWRHCVRGAIDDAKGTVTVSTAAPGAAQGDVKPSGIQEKTVLYAFQEDEARRGAPVVFLGEFQAVAVTNTTVTLTYTVPLDNNLQSKLRASQGAWTLCEQLPADSHGAFAARGPDDEHLFGAATDAQLRQWLPRDRFKQLSDQQYNELIGRYARDGQQAREDDPRENVWMKVKFLKQHEVDVDVERPKGAPTQLTLRDSPFDDAGRARLDLLRRGKSGPAEKVVFGPNDVGILEYAEAQRLIGAKVCDPGAPIYVRPLNDYTYAYHENFRRRMQLDEDARTVLANTATIEDANAKALQQISAQETDKKKLGEDLAKLQIELAEVAQYVQTIDRQWEAVRGELSQLYRTNLALAEELAEIQRRLAEEINRRTAPAAD